MFIFHRSEEILKFWVTARFGTDIFLGGKDQNAFFDAIESDVSNQKRQELMLDFIFHDFW